MRKTDEQVLADHTRADASGCLIWTGAQNKGYGKLLRHGRTWAAHRFAWTCARGAIPEGLVIDHLCRQPLCVNVEHMEVTTVRMNTLRGISDSAKNAVKTHCKRGHKFTAANTRIVVGNGRPRRECRTCKRLHARARRMKMHLDDFLAAFPGVNIESLAPSRPKAGMCHRGHPMSGENLRDSRGRRTCRACSRINQAAYRQRQREAVSA